MLHKNADYSYDDFSQLFRYVVVQKDVRPCVESLNVQMHPKYRSFAAVDGKAIGKLSFIIALDTLNDNGKNKRKRFITRCLPKKTEPVTRS